MKQCLIFCALLGLFFTASSQDTIITHQGDTIECKITRVAEDFIHFSVHDKQSGVLLLRSRLPMSQIKSYTRSEVPSNAEEEEITSIPADKKEVGGLVSKFFDPPRFRLSLNTGFSYQFAGYERLPVSYKSQLQSLWNFGGDLSYFTSDEFGFGVKFNRISTKADHDFATPLRISNTQNITSIRDERIRFTYIGLSAYYRNIVYDDQYFHYYVSAGSLHYRTDFEGDGIPFFQDGSTFGFTLGMIYDFVLVENFGLGFGIELTIARLTEYNNNGTQVAADFNVSRIDLTFGVRFLK